MVAVYTGSTVDGLTRITQDDNDCPNEYGARVSFTATAGQEYRIAVDGAYGDWGDLTLRWSRTILAPVNHGPPSILGRPIDGAQLSATQGVWGGTPPFTFGYQWLRCTTTAASRSPERTGRPISSRAPTSRIGWSVLVTASNALAPRRPSRTRQGSSRRPLRERHAADDPRPPVPRRRAERRRRSNGPGRSPSRTAYRWERCRAGKRAPTSRARRPTRSTVTTWVAASSSSSLRRTAPVRRRPLLHQAAGPLGDRSASFLASSGSGSSLRAARSAQRTARSGGCGGRVRLRPLGRVIAQSPRPGLRRPAGSEGEACRQQGATVTIPRDQRASSR